MITCEKDGPLWTVTLDRPDKANALTAAMLEQLVACIDEAHGTARAVLITGRGRTFSAGADLDEAKQGLATSPLWETLSDRIAALPCLTVAALNGTLAGGAFGMAMACDIRLAARHATFFYPVMQRGYLPQAADAARLKELIGPARAKLLLMGGARLSADEAFSFGLVEGVCHTEEVLPRAAALAEDALSASPDHAAAIKALI
ncbi:Enoyl-CoA hydratase/carnithine racemase [Tranquillimonas rosea]|uniref:Enoyl-CoA hydratase/carnithine racemase n=1 Tax=Tranquillimonas rosea TaxID=641238 RepID=A0A1H9W3K2_9RHOB|nr:enoyl-CoA hydratase/isomerase family protein [Tranquillimonas rosea]SES28359.1 Enoyl-CoA hydratase/carnithine racemase [Tranquillimonas rosea]